MSTIFSPIRERAIAIATGGHGLSGLSADATARAIPARRFRMGLNYAPLDDPGAMPAATDRACSFRWLSTVDGPDPADERAPNAIRIARFAWSTAYVYGSANVRHVHLAAGTSESADAAVRDAEGRALNDAERLRRAFCWTELWAGTTPAVIDCARESATTIEDQRDGRVIATTVYALMVEIDMGAVYEP